MSKNDNDWLLREYLETIERTFDASIKHFRYCKKNLDRDSLERIIDETISHYVKSKRGLKQLKKALWDKDS